MQSIKDYMNKINMLVKYNVLSEIKKKKKPTPKSAGFAGVKNDANQPAASDKGKELKIIASYVQGIREAREGMLNAHK